ncbi:MAG TPA: cobalamin-binding protein [Anaerolineae bacterium]|nr:cobalamin-binding protein [Anaerolineae bacterium]
MGRAVNLPEPPQRIISLVPSQTELLFDLGLDAEIVGVTKFCRHPAAQTQSRQSIGGTKKFRFDIIDQLQPDLILGNKEENYREGIERLAARYPVWMSDIHTLPDALAMIRSVGALTGKPETADQLADQIAAAFANLPRAARPYRAAYLIWQNPLMAAGNDTFIHDILSRMGLENVLAGYGRYPQLTPEQIQAAQPALILLSSEPYPFREKHRQSFTAQFPRAHVELVDGEMFSWYGSRLLPAANYLRQFLQTL